MEPEAYSDQLIAALRQIHGQAIENRADPKLTTMLISAMGTAVTWSGTRRPPSLPAGASLAQIGDYSRRYADALGLEIELMDALRAISLDFAVEAIDNAIRVVESQTEQPQVDLGD